ncbi:TetR/AcrR family transcriptional regulator [Polaromonas sp. SM01]|uniref:TetR/AcrR family transcriptional regulator n=1 Tax=Polaromonas sp. SM01 TaxID=3085630 RepID=UPI002981FBAD|nr:TetR/AcrR family transcriptional regulator [Polaromonas sp. SM01]MDW5444021.1 TetR/AcrR family transcriptional regulator [Polaromonas sp. SM01]
MKAETGPPADPPKKTGRPRSFDRDAALERAMLIFWRYGYEATSLNELTTAMGITPPSLYSAFGDKEHLFLEAVERYLAGPGGAHEGIFADAPTAREAIERLLEATAIEQTRTCHPPGCLVVTAALNCSPASAHVEAALVKLRKAVQIRIRARIERGVCEGDLPADTDPGALATFYVVVTQGMAIHARDGASRKTLRAIATQAMRAWPAN